MKKLPPLMMTMPGELRFTKDGVWLHDGEIVTNQKIAGYFARRLRYSQDHNGYIIEVDGKCVPVTVEDTCFVVKEILTNFNPWQVVLNDDLTEPFDPTTLRVGKENVYYCNVKEGKELARILRGPVQTLLPHIREENGAYLLRIFDKDYPIEERIFT